MFLEPSERCPAQGMKATLGLEGAGLHRRGMGQGRWTRLSWPRRLTRGSQVGGLPGELMVGMCLRCEAPLFLATLRLSRHAKEFPTFLVVFARTFQWEIEVCQ